MLPADKQDKIYNALLVGMALEDAYIYAGCTPREIELDMEDPENQLLWQRVRGELEFSLLSDLRRVATKQIAQGRMDAITWQLEKFFPRYSSKAAPSTGTINLIVNKEDTKDIEEVYKP